MFFHGALGQLHGECYFAVRATVDTVEQKDLPGTLGSRTQGVFDTLQIVIHLQGLLQRLAHKVRAVL